ESSGLTAGASFTVRADWATFRAGPAKSGANPFENVLRPGNVSTLRQAWSTGAPFNSTSPAVVGGVVYLCDDSGSGPNVYAFDVATGATLWSTTLPGCIQASPAVAHGMVYLETFVQELYALDATSGATIWHVN